MAKPAEKAAPGTIIAPPCPPSPEPELGDLRFRALIGEQDWAALPAAIRERFGHRVAGGDAIVYCGQTVECRISRAGRVLATLGRLIGAPLPLSTDTNVPAIVTVTEDAATGGQFWTRHYGRRVGFPQVIHSSKRFAGRTGLEEYIGRGVGIALRVRVEDGALHFLSDHYFLAVNALRWRIPTWLAPGGLVVTHIDHGEGSFAFRLVLRHWLLGEMIRQTAVFREQSAVARPPMWKADTAATFPRASHMAAGSTAAAKGAMLGNEVRERAADEFGREDIFVRLGNATHDS